MASMLMPLWLSAAGASIFQFPAERLSAGQLGKQNPDVRSAGRVPQKCQLQELFFALLGDTAPLILLMFFWLVGSTPSPLRQ
jgi:hypothetical protein